MEAYSAFAKVYDRFMENVPYDKWCDFLDFIISKIGISEPVRNSADALESERNLVLDLACGTGILTEMMYDKGYDMIGVDISQEMLDVALRRKLAKNIEKADKMNSVSEEDIVNNEGILYICQDMCELDLYSTIGTVYSSCDSINYLLEEAELYACFDKVANYLYPEGLFIFDFNTVHKYRDVIGQTTIAENEEECSFIWDNFYDSEDEVNEYDLTLFIRNEDGLYEKSEEIHYQRGYEASDMCDFLRKSGLKVLVQIDEQLIDDEMTRNEIAARFGRDNEESVKEVLSLGVNENSERIIIVAKKE